MMNNESRNVQMRTVFAFILDAAKLLISITFICGTGAAADLLQIKTMFINHLEGTD